MKIKYEDNRFYDASLAKITQANVIIAEYSAQGYNLTLRQLYYQFVSRSLIPNNDKEYKSLGDLISKARRAGLIDWDAIVDRTRYLRKASSWDSPDQLIRDCAAQFALDIWEDQTNYVEVWFEKDALLGVFERACEKYRLPYFSCRGYGSDSELWSAAQRLRIKGGLYDVHVLHFGDHDPSGIDMTRDIKDRLTLFGARFELERMTLNMKQVYQYNPPPNPAKEADSRFSDYLDKFGSSCWELDALEPSVIVDLVNKRVAKLVNKSSWTETESREREHKGNLQLVADNWEKVIENFD